MIVAGHVRVNDVVVTQLGSCADPAQDRITVNGKPIKIPDRKAYYLFHKPKNIMVTRHDPEGRPTIYDYFKKIPERINPVGRLDFGSEGLLLLTNDGELHARLTHPSHEIPKTYQIKVSGIPSREDLAKLRHGIDIGGYVTRKADVEIGNKTGDDCWLEMTLREGKNRQIRRMLEALGFTVVKLIRVRIGPLALKNLRPGEYRPLTSQERTLLVDFK